MVLLKKDCDLDEIWQNYSKDSRTELASFIFHVCLLFINFSSFKPDTKTNGHFSQMSQNQSL